MTSSDGSGRSPVEVFVISDGTGETCAAAVRAAMVQFPDPWRLRTFGSVRLDSELHRVLARAAEVGALVVFSLVEGETVEALRSEAARMGVTTVDLLGPLIAKVAQLLHREPRHQPGLLHGFTDEHFERVEAVEFAVRHDDGANLHTLAQADIVLAGVSRTSKTPLSMYLAQRGYKTGNVPLVLGMKPPQVLLEMDRRKVFGLVIDPASLKPLREARVRAIGSRAYASAYTNAESLSLELDEARRLFRSCGWKTIDITGRATEENASRILELYQRDRPD